MTKLEVLESVKEVQALYAAPTIGVEPIQALYAAPSPDQPIQVLYAAPSPDQPIQVLYAAPTPTFTPSLYAAPTPTPTFTPSLYAAPTPTPTFTPSLYAAPTPTPTFTPSIYAAPTPEPVKPSIGDAKVVTDVPGVKNPGLSKDSILNVTFTDIENNINTINKSVTEMRANWDSIKNETLTKIQDSWAGKDCEAYINKISEMDTKMENSFKALELLSKTYSSAKDQVSGSQEAIKGYIDSI